MCDECAPAGGWGRRRFLAAAGALALAPAVAVPRSATAQAAAPAIVPRQAWGADLPPAGPLAPEPDVRFLLVHHTVNTNDYAPDDVVGLLRAMYRFHTGAEKAWPDIAYNFVVDRFGRIWEARAGSADGPVAGDATGGSQGFDQKCAFLGDHRTEAPTAEAVDAMTSLLAFLADRHGIATAPGSTTSFVSRGSNRHPSGETVVTPTITGHRTMSFTACPGDAAMAIVTGPLPGAVTARRRAPATTSSSVTTTSSAPPATAPPTSSATTAGVPSAAAPAEGTTTAATASPADRPLHWMVGGGVVAVVAGGLLRLRTRR